MHAEHKPAITEAPGEARVRQSLLSIAASAQWPCCSERSEMEAAILATKA